MNLPGLVLVLLLEGEIMFTICFARIFINSESF